MVPLALSPVFFRRSLWQIVLVAIIYFLVAHLGLHLASFHKNSSPVWPASGLAVAVLAAWGWRLWPGIFLGAFLANWLAATPVAVCLGIAAGNTGEALLGAFALHFLRGRLRNFEEQRETFAYLIAAVLPTALGATVGVTSLWAAGLVDVGTFRKVWLTWWVGDTLGILVLAPLLGAWLRGDRPRKVVTGELILFTAMSVILSALVFFRQSSPLLVFLVYPMLLWAIWRLGAFEAKLFALFVSIVSVWGASHGLGPFHLGTLNQNLLCLQLFLAAVSVTALALEGIRLLGPLRLPGFTLVVMWSVTALIFHSFLSSESLQDARHMETLTSRTTKGIQDRLALYEDALRGGVSLIVASERVERDEWRRYVETFEISRRYAGLQAMGIARPVLRKNVPAFLRSVKKDGLPNFSIRSFAAGGDDRSEHFVVTFVEPWNLNFQAIGFDLGSEMNRRIAAEEARDSGKPMMTAKVNLLKREKGNFGFLLFIPVYHGGAIPLTVEARRNAFEGWVFAPIAAEVFFRDILGADGKQIDLFVFDGPALASERLLFASNDPAPMTSFDHQSQITLAGRPITLAWRRTGNFISSVDTTTAWIAACGALIAILAASMVAGLQSVNVKSQRLADSMPQIVWTAEPDGTVDYFNERWYEVTGLERDRMNKGPMPEILEPSDMVAMMGAWMDAVRTGQPYEFQYRIRGRNHSGYRWYLSRALPFRDKDGRIIKWFGTITDIHDQKQTESERTALMAREQAAIEASRMKSEFLARMSHEIRTPINGILGMATLLSDTTMNPEQRDGIESILQSGEDLLTVINDILDFSKVEAGKLEFDEIDFDLIDTVDQSVRAFAFQARRKNLQVIVDLDPRFPRFLRGDPGRLRQVFNNLISNALKFTAKGSIRVRGRLVSAESGSATLRFEIDDSGIGIPEHVMDRMFQAFSQADSSTSRRFGGTGLGLSICKYLVEKMSGRIGVSSIENVGSTFWFEISLPVGSKIAGAVTEEKPQASELQGLRVLVAEDTPVNQKIMLKMLEKMGVRAAAVANGLEAVAAIEDGSYDLILMDCQMPEMDGYEATRRIRVLSDADKAKIPIVAVTANAIKGDRERCLEAGMDDYVTKPVRFDELTRAIARWSGRSMTKTNTEKPLRAEASPSVIDRGALNELYDMGGDEIVASLIDIYLKTLDEALGRLQSAVVDQAWQKAAFEAHSLKSSSRTLGALRLGDLCASIEEKGKAGFGDAIPTLAAEIFSEAPLVKAELLSIRQRSGAAA